MEEEHKRRETLRRRVVQFESRLALLTVNKEPVIFRKRLYDAAAGILKDAASVEERECLRTLIDGILRSHALPPIKP